MAQNGLIHVGIKGTVLALDRATGEEIWRSALKGSDFVNVVLQETELLASTQGEIFCLDPATGHIRWHNKLTGLGRGLVTIAAPGNQAAVITGEKQRRDQEAAAAVVVTTG